MEVLAIILIAVALADGKGSGPYLYQKPEGQAFFLPSEIVKPVPSPAINLEGSEASGSDSLREYGPPKVQDISQNLLNQGLPDVTIEQTFGFSDKNDGSLSQVAEKIVQISEAKAEVVSTELPTTASQSSLNDDPPISAELPILDFEVKETTTTPNIELTTESTSQSAPLYQESGVPSNSQATLQYVSEKSNQYNSEYQTAEVANAQSNQQNSLETVSLQSTKQDSTQYLQYQQESSTASDFEKFPGTVDSIGNTEVLLVNALPANVPKESVPVVQNIPDIIASLEQEILTQQAEVNQVSQIASVKTSAQVPEGFLEYGPPEFIEYGPPKEDQDKLENVQAIETNETRRRRFSPRLRFVKN